MKETIIKVKEMMCNGCENRIQNALKTIEGIESVEADHTKGIVKITSNDNIEENVIKEKIEDIGFEVEKEEK